MAFADKIAMGFDIESIYEPILALSGLGLNQLRGLDLPGLRDALARVNDAIANPDQFPRVELTARPGHVVGVLADPGTGTIGALPILLQRKRMILDAISELESREEIGGLRDLIDRLPEGEMQQALRERLDALEEAASKSDDLARDAAEEQNALQFKRERELALLKIQLSERRWKLRSAQLARESVAPMVGAALLIGLAATLIVAMFAKIEVSVLVSNSFLIVLGYFFGQSSDRSRTETDTDRA
ncbi:hypothetical protein [Streptomyces sp. NPDC058614]|uniref:hypothetical protein n=1 Tax=Streptomyces sp. NPDC058614 TaxID=3346557 RepID=UPI003660BACA